MANEILSALIGLIGGIIGGFLSIKGSIVSIKLTERIARKKNQEQLFFKKTITEGIEKLLTYLKYCNTITTVNCNHNDFIKYRNMPFPLNEALSTDNLLKIDIINKINSINKSFNEIIKNNSNNAAKLNQEIMDTLREIDYYHSKLLLKPIPNLFSRMRWVFVYKCFLSNSKKNIK